MRVTFSQWQHAGKYGIGPRITEPPFPLLVTDVYSIAPASGCGMWKPPASDVRPGRVRLCERIYSNSIYLHSFTLVVFYSIGRAAVKHVRVRHWAWRSTAHKPEHTITFSPTDDGQHRLQVFEINGIFRYKEASLHASGSSSLSEAEVPLADCSGVAPLAGLTVVFCFVSCVGVSIRSAGEDTRKITVV